MSPPFYSSFSYPIKIRNLCGEMKEVVEKGVKENLSYVTILFVPVLCCVFTASVLVLYAALPFSFSGVSASRKYGLLLLVLMTFSLVCFLLFLLSIGCVAIFPLMDVLSKLWKSKFSPQSSEFTGVDGVKKEDTEWSMRRALKLPLLRSLLCAIVSLSLLTAILVTAVTCVYVPPCFPTYITCENAAQLTFAFPANARCGLRVNGNNATYEKDGKTYCRCQTSGLINGDVWEDNDVEINTFVCTHSVAWTLFGLIVGFVVFPIAIVLSLAICIPFSIFSGAYGAAKERSLVKYFTDKAATGGVNDPSSISGLSTDSL